MPEIFDVSVVIAAYNDGAYLANSIQTLVAELSRSRYSYELIFVDDASRDASRGIIQDYCRAHPDFTQCVLHESNRGRGAAVTAGIQRARAAIVGFIDIDLETHPLYIPHLASRIEEGADVVCARRVYKIRIQSIIRWMVNRGYNALVRACLLLPFEDTETGCKFFNRKKILPILKHVKDRRWFWDTEIIARAYYGGLTIQEVPALYIRRGDKQSSVRLLQDSIYYLKKLISLKRELPALRAEAYWQTQPEAFSSYYTQKGFPGNIVSGFLRARTSRIMRRIGDVRDRNLLDIGCGSGEFIPVLHQAGAHITALDYSYPMLRSAKARMDQGGPQADLIAGDASSLPFKDKSFEVVTCVGVLDYVSAIAPVMQEMQRVLKPGGRMIVTIPHSRSLFGFLRGSLGEYLRYAFFKLPPLVSVVDLKRMSALCRETGFTVQSVESLYHTMGIIELKRL